MFYHPLKPFEDPSRRFNIYIAPAGGDKYQIYVWKAEDIGLYFKDRYGQMQKMVVPVVEAGSRLRIVFPPKWGYPVHEVMLPVIVDSGVRFYQCGVYSED